MKVRTPRLTLDIRQSRIVAWLSAIGGIIAIAGLLSPSLPGILGTLVTVPVPLWSLLAVATVEPGIAILTMQIIKARESAPSTPLPPDNPIPLDSLHLLRVKAEALESKLRAYETLEREIMGVLASGEELDLYELTKRLGLSYTSGGDRQVRLAVAALQEQGKITGTGSGSFTKLKKLNQ